MKRFGLLLLIASACCHGGATSGAPMPAQAAGICAKIADAGCAVGLSPACPLVLEKAVQENRVTSSEMTCAEVAPNAKAMAACGPGAAKYFACTGAP